MFSATSELESYYRFKVGKKLGIQMSAGVGPQLFFGDMEFDRNERRTGLGWSASVSGTLASQGRFVNPQLALLLSGIQTGRTDFQSNSSAVSLQNLLLFSDGLRGLASLGVSETAFDYRKDGYRKDRLFSLGFTLSKMLGPRFSLSMDASVSRNLSTVSDTYQYFRWTLSSGVNYSLF
jgi:hypothetical protein